MKRWKEKNIIALFFLSLHHSFSLYFFLLLSLDILWISGGSRVYTNPCCMVDHGKSSGPIVWPSSIIFHLPISFMTFMFDLDFVKEILLVEEGVEWNALSSGL